MENTINLRQKFASPVGSDSTALEKPLHGLLRHSVPRNDEPPVIMSESTEAERRLDERKDLLHNNELLNDQDETGLQRPNLSFAAASPRNDIVPHKDNYIEAFINNKMVTSVFPNTMNWLNIGGNVFSLAAHMFGFSDGVKKFSKNLGAMCTKAFMVSNSVINIVERCYTRNFLSALGYLNDIMIAGTVGQDDTYLARGTASGTYNMANSLTTSIKRDTYSSVEDHVMSMAKAYKKFFNNFFSPNIIKNFLNHENGMWAIFGGLFSNIGALSWMLSGKVKIPTIVRDVAGVMMDIEQLNPGHVKAGRKNYFFSGVFLAVGTLSDLLMRMIPKSKEVLVPLTFIFDGVGRHLLRLDQNDRELKKLRSKNLEMQAA